MANSLYIFDYLNDIWQLLSDQDQNLFAETWKAYEQTYGYVWMQQFESDLANTITNLPLYNIKRWLQHRFDSTTQLLLAATYTSTADLSKGADLSSRNLIRMSVDGGPQLQLAVHGLNPYAVTLAEIVASINLQLGQNVASASGALLQFTSLTKGPTSSFKFYPATNPALDASQIILGLAPTQLPLSFPQFPYAFQLGEKDIVAIPILQDKIHDDQVTTLLTNTVDFSIQFGTGVAYFAEPPPALMWAKDTLVNFETPYNNFGYLMDLYDNNTPNYLKAVQGLWYAFWTGPTPQNIQRSLYLLFGLPSASNPGTVTALATNSATLTYTNGSIETFSIPADLTPIVALGQVVTKYQPLVNGINVYDKINYPGFLIKEVGRPGVQPFLTQYATKGSNPNTDETRALKLLEENTYLPQIAVQAFVNPNINLGTVQTFLRNIQPRARTFLLQILVGSVADPLPLMDEGLTGHVTPAWPNGRPSLELDISFDATFNLDWNDNTMGNQALWDEAEANPYTYLTLDDTTLSFSETVQIDVYQGLTLIDSFTVEG